MKDSLATKGIGSPIQTPSFPSVNQPTNSGSKFFSKGPIRPASNMPLPAQIPTDQMIRQNSGRQQQLNASQQYYQDHYGDEYDDEMDDAEYGEDQPQRAGGRILSPEQEMQILKDLLISAQRNKEFLKVLNILQNDPELRPLIFEHEALLRALKDMHELKAEQMLSILTAAETEMYESSKKHEETQALSKQGTLPKPQSKDVSVEALLISTQDFNNLENTIKELKNQTQELQLQSSGELSEKQKTEQEIKRLKTQVKTLQESSKKEVDDLTRQLNQMAEEVNKAKIETENALKRQVVLEKSQNQGKDLSFQEVKKLKDELSAVNLNLKKVNEENNKLKIQNDQVKNHERLIAQQLAEIKSLTDNNKQLHKKLAQMRTSIEYTSPNGKDLKARPKSQTSSRSNTRLRLDDDASLSSSNNRKRQQAQIDQMQKHIQQLESKLQKKVDSPLMATFSPKKQNQQIEGLEDIHTRLHHLHKKILGQIGKPINLKKSQPETVQSILDQIYDIQIAFDEMIDIQQNTQNLPTNQLKYQTPHRSPAFTNHDDVSTVFSNIGRQQRGSSAEDHFDLRSRLLDEKELRLQTQEKLTKTKEDQLKYVNEIERLRHELRNQPIKNLDIEKKEISQLQEIIDKIQDENVTLKLQIAELETVIHDERSNKALSYQGAVELIKQQMQQNLFDQKIKYEETLLQVREQSHVANIQSAQLEERLLVARDTIQQLRQQIHQLVQDGQNAEKENKQLNSALDYENLRNEQILQRTNQIQTELNIRKQVVDKSNFEKIVEGYQQQIASLKEQGSAMDKITKQRFESTILDLQNQNAQLLKKQTEMVDQNRGVGTGLRINLEVMQEKANKLQALLLRSFLRRKGDLAKQKAFFTLHKKLKDTKADETDLLQERISHLQNQNLALLKQIGKILRSINLGQPVKLNLSGLVIKGTEGLEFILSGLKKNQVVTELNLSQNELESEDLVNICERLSGDEKLTKLRLANNLFQDPTPLVELIHANGSTYTYLDLSNIKLTSQSLQQFQGALLNLGYIQDFALCDILAEEQKSDTCYLTNRFFDSVLSLKSIRSLDFSKNRFFQDSLAFIFKKLPTLKNLQTLSLSQINLQDQVINEFTMMLSNIPNLTVLNLSGNGGLSADSLKKILITLKQKNQKLTDLDLAKLNFMNDEDCFKEISNALGQLKHLKTLYLSKIGLDDVTAFYLIESIARSQSLQVLKLDFNKLTGVFVERLCKKLALASYTPTSALNSPNNENTSILNSESEDTSRIGTPRAIQSLSQSAGLQNLSFEGNKIGDRGAEAISNLIQTKNDATKSIKIINLNECNIMNDGFQKLKQALATRGNLANQYNLTHIGVKVERNPFEDQN